MPIIKSAKKALRQTKRNTLRNNFFRDAYKESRLAFEKAIKAKDVEAAKKAFFNTTDKDGKTVKSGLQSNIDKLVKKNILHKNNAARKKSLFVKKLKAIETPTTTKTEEAPAKKKAVKTTKATKAKK